MEINIATLSLLILITGITLFKTNSSYLNLLLTYSIALQSALLVTSQLGLRNLWLINVDFIFSSAVLVTISSHLWTNIRKSEVALWLCIWASLVITILLEGINDLSLAYRLLAHTVVIASSVRLGFKVLSEKTSSLFQNDRFWIALAHFIFFSVSIFVSGFRVLAQELGYTSLLSLQGKVLYFSGLAFSILLLVPSIISWKKRKLHY